MILVTPRVTARHYRAPQSELTVLDKRETMSRVMAVGIFEKTVDAKIIVLAVNAGDHLGLFVF